MPNTDKSNLKKISFDELISLIDSGGQIQDIEISDEICIDIYSLSNKPKTLNIHQCKFSILTIQLELERITISNCEFEEINIKGNIQNLSLFNINSETAIVRVNNAVIQKINLHDCQMIDKFILGDLGTVVIGELFCFKSNINVLALLGTFKKVFLNLGNTISAITFNGEFNDVEITNRGISDEKFSPNIFENIFYLNKAEKNILKIQNSSVTNFNAIGQHVDTYIELLEVKCEDVNFIEDFGANGKIKIKTCNELSKISFTSANISSLEIFNSDFSKTHFVSCQSIIENLRWQSVEWPEKLKYYIDPKLNVSFCRETLRNLKFNAHTQQDTINYIKFHSLELQAYEIQIESKKWYNGDRILLWLNKISNKQGLSWGRGIKFTIGSWICSYLLFLIITRMEDIYALLIGRPVDWTYSLDIGNGISYLWSLNFLNTLSSWMEKIEFSSVWWIAVLKVIQLLFGIFIYLIGKIAIGYGIYQTIVAFRKYGKKQS